MLKFLTKQIISKNTSKVYENRLFFVVLIGFQAQYKAML